MPSKIPEFVYFIRENTRWPITAVPDGQYVVEDLIAEVRRRVSLGDKYAMSHLHICRCRVSEVTEVEIVPSTFTKAWIREKAEEE